MVLTVIPSAATSPAIVLKSPIAAIRFALERVRWGIGSRTELEPTFTIRPHLRSRMPGSTASASVRGASTSDPYASSHSSCSWSSTAPSGGPPVLVTRMSTGPSFDATSSGRAASQSTAEAAELCRAAHFQGEPTPALIRFSNGSGDPESDDWQRDSRGMAVRLRPSGGDEADILAVTTPAFVTRTPEDFLELIRLRKPD